MKKKIISVLLTIVLVLSFSLVTAVPAVAADREILNQTRLAVLGSATVEWDTEVVYSGDYSAHGVVPADADFFNVVHMDIGDGTPISLSQIDTVQFMEYVVTLGGMWDGSAAVLLFLNDPATEAPVEGVASWWDGYDDAITFHNDGEPAPVGEWSVRDLADVDQGWVGYADSIGIGTVEPLSYWTDTWERANWEVVFISVAVGAGDWAGYEGYIDNVMVNWTGGVDTYLTEPRIVNTATVQKGYNYIQDAIDGASGSDTISMVAGMYVEDLDIDATKVGLELAGATGATIKGVSLSEWTVSTLPNIEILAGGVSIHGFTIQGPEPDPPLFVAGMIIGAPNVEIYENAFDVNNASEGDDIGQAIVTFNKLAIPEVDISGLNIHDNTFIHRGEGIYGYEGIYINRDAGAGNITITDNDFTGDILRGITVERSNATISDNSLVATAGAVWTGVLVMDVGTGLPIDAVDVTGNTIMGFGNSVKIGNSGGDHVLTNIDVSGNSMDGKVLVRSSADGVAVNNNTLEFVWNTDNTGLDAQNNWWGQSSGPAEGAVTSNVDYELWLLTEGGATYDKTLPLPVGWSIVSPDAELESWAVADEGLMYAYKDGGFTTDFTPDAITPMFVKTATGGGIGFNYAVGSMGLFTTDLEAGWNLIGVPLTDASTRAILSPLRYGQGDETALATLVSQGQYNPSEASFYEPMTSGFDWIDLPALYPFDGYWAYMNVAKEFGVIVVQGIQ